MTAALETAQRSFLGDPLASTFRQREIIKAFNMKLTDIVKSEKRGLTKYMKDKWKVNFDGGEMEDLGEWAYRRGREYGKKTRPWSYTILLYEGDLEIREDMASYGMAAKGGKHLFKVSEWNVPKEPKKKKQTKARSQTKQATVKDPAVVPKAEKRRYAPAPVRIPGAIPPAKRVAKKVPKMTDSQKNQARRAAIAEHAIKEARGAYVRTTMVLAS